ncbi:phenylalanine--tRNA ligase subunit beta [bacterium]|nr:phenylalanine--tRNA ligase subunit beta [bacterium]
MYISYAFLQEILGDRCPTLDELSKKLIHIGFEVEEMIQYPSNQIMTVLVQEAELIPDTKLLKVNITDLTHTFQVITSDLKIQQGQIYAYAEPGTEIDGKTLQSKDFQQYTSQGMLLSYKELGLPGDLLSTSEREGLFRLPDDSPIGKNFYETFWLTKPILNVYVPFNRPDCYSMIGLLREIMCAFEISSTNLNKKDIRWIFPDFKEALLKRSVSRSDFKRIEVVAKDACPFYTGMIIENVTIKPSGYEIRKRLFAFQMKPVNNIVDIANLIMIFFGQPLHTFDYDKIINKHILVRYAAKGETLDAIDNKCYSLQDTDLIIADEIHPIGLAGIIGGKDTEIDNHTKHIFIESAYFNPTTIMNTSNRLNLVTDASSRFGRGVEPSQVRDVLVQTGSLISILSNATIAGETYREGAFPVIQQNIELKLSHFTKVTGMDISKYSASRILANLEIPFDIKDQDTMLIHVPSFRSSDLKESVDIIEELLRFIGYDKIKPTPLQFAIHYTPENENYTVNEWFRNKLVSMGFYEIVTDSITSEDEVKLLFPKDLTNLFRIDNPLKTGFHYLVPDKVLMHLPVIQRNQSRKKTDMKLFEIGKNYYKEETEALFITLNGQMHEDNWLQKSVEIDFYWGKGYFEQFLTTLGVPFELKVCTEAPFDKESVSYYYQNTLIGYFGKVKPSLLKAYDIDNPVYYGTLLIHKLQKFILKSPVYKPISFTQDIVRDIAFFVEKTVKIGDILQSIQTIGGDTLQRTLVFDKFEGDKLNPSQKSIAIRMYFNFRSNISKEQIQLKIEEIIRHLEKTHHIELRKQ